LNKSPALSDGIFSIVYIKSEYNTKLFLPVAIKYESQPIKNFARVDEDPIPNQLAVFYFLIFHHLVAKPLQT
jgi:hypothetical protein